METVPQSSADERLPEAVPHPTVGRIVHFHDPSHPVANPAAAVVTKVYAPESRTVELFVLPCSWYASPGYRTSVPHQSEVQDHGAVTSSVYWTWPPRS